MLKNLDIKVEGNPVAHIFSSDIELCKKSIVQVGRFHGDEIVSETGERGVIISSKNNRLSESYPNVFFKNTAKQSCKKSPLMSANFQKIKKEMRNSWSVNILINQIEKKMRSAQHGALLSIFSHWTKSSLPATVVLPTGTGKTETLLAVIGMLAPRCTLVIVPSDPLRTQFFEKASVWGCLKEIGVFDTNMHYPIIGMLRNGFKDFDNFNCFFDNCDIIITTMPLLSKMNNEMLSVVKDKCDLVAIDEAHHLPAPTWTDIVSIFNNSKILQFTATPFRSDGKYISGDVIYTYPLNLCQEEGYFRSIEFIAVSEYFYDKADEVICDTAVKKLRQDISRGLHHSLMARAATIARAKKILNIYQEKHPDLKPVLLYGSMTASTKISAKKKLLSGESKVVICVDMLGEGFDFPQLKVAAIHDQHKSLPITLQFIGRFTRSGNENIGDASVIANIADTKIQGNISSLYSQDANWNKIIRVSYENAINHEIDFQNFINGFAFDGISGFSLRNIHPKFSSSIFSVSGDVNFEKLKKDYNDGINFRLALNMERNVTIIIQKYKESIDWGNISELININYHCMCIYHDVKSNLLFVHSTEKELVEVLAEVISPKAKRIADKRIHRCLFGINRLMLSNVGLKQRLFGPIRYRQYMGLDVGQGLKDRITENAYTAMLYGFGYENATKANVGCSLKGKVWSRDGGTVLEWMEWCDHIGKKIIDESINVESILNGVLFPELITELPENRTVIMADWPDFIFENMFYKSVIKVAHEIEYDIGDCQIVIDRENSIHKKIIFNLECPEVKYTYCLEFASDKPEGYTVSCSGRECTVIVGKDVLTGSEFFFKHPPMFWLDDTSVIADGCLLVRAMNASASGTYDISRIQVHDWSSTNIRKESQGKERESDSIQAAMIDHAQRENPLFIFDDDGSGEIADLIAVYDKDDKILVKLYHCKYSSDDLPGCRVGDIYEMCGQAQKSVKWAGSKDVLIAQLKKREKSRMESVGVSRFVLGGLREISVLSAIAKQKRVQFEVVLVQPGLSRSSLLSSPNQASILRLFACTASYLAETFSIDMHIIINN